MSAPTFLRSSRRFLGPQFKTANDVPGWIRAGSWLLWLVVYLAGVNTDNDVFLLVLLTGMFVLFTIMLSGDRRVYRNLGMNRARAMLQQLWITVPLLLLVAIGSLFVVSASNWPWILLLMAALAAADLGASAWAWGSGRELGTSSRIRWFIRPAERGPTAWRLIWGPMLRWCVPAGLVSGLLLTTLNVTGFREPEIPAVILSVLLIFLAPATAYSGNTADAATWQAFGMPRRTWALASSSAGIVSQMLGWMTALGVVALAASGGLVEQNRLGEVFWPVVGALVLTLGVTVLIVIAEHGPENREPPALIAVGLGLITYASFQLTGTAVFAVVVGIVSLAIGLWLQYRFAFGLGSGGRAMLDTRKFAD